MLCYSRLKHTYLPNAFFAIFNTPMSDVGCDQHSRDLPLHAPGLCEKSKLKKTYSEFLKKKSEVEEGNIVTLKAKTDNIVTCVGDYRLGFGMDARFINHLNTQLVIRLNYSNMAQSLQRLAAGWTTKESEFEAMCRGRIFISLCRPDRLWGVHPASY
jgi:hypothetical protein